MNIRRFRYVFQNEAGAGGAAGSGDAGSGGAGAGAGGDAAGAAGTGATGAGGAGGAAAGAGGAAGSALAAGAAAAGAAAGGAGATGATPGPNDWIPEKHRVFAEDGKTLNLEASARKVAEAHGHLEKRLGSGDVPPATVEGYKVNVPEAMKGKIDADALAKDDGFKGFLGQLHAAGASQKVVDAAVATMLERGTAMREAQPIIAAADCEATLRGQDGWKSDQEYTAQVGLAFNASKSIFGADFDGVLKDYGNDPRFIRGMAAIGKEMQEDVGPSPEALMQIQGDVDTLMSSPAYLNANDPKHAETVAKVNALTARQVGTNPVASGRTHSFKSA